MAILTAKRQRTSEENTHEHNKARTGLFKARCTFSFQFCSVRFSVHIVCPSVLRLSSGRLHKTYELKSIFIEENIVSSVNF